ncbi:MAG: 1-deoxy-D-xylulose-5-phosphate reductoisomerase [Candidatus Faecousia sp.]|nr:1-deoxy-D-xylulose-5-phosphate reductoisomerase [Lachnospiraceae bacterium]MDY2809143.1 1-deoxy-D-xylulose-5-phosphate reductoisomerase [Candidatus Faecousia sp.]
MKKIAILGSTGSIGTQTLDIVRAQGDLQVTAMAAGHNIDLFEQQIREFMPKNVALWEEKDALDLKARVADLGVKVHYGMEGLMEIAADPDSEILVTAIVGMLGLRPTVAAIQSGKNIALANKETLVTAGHLIMPMAKEYDVQILPVDSEHSAIFQALNGEHPNKIDKILLTASGGPFRGKTREELASVTLEDALKHPNWSMGRKITVDSSTMVNKGLEVMEAKWLFGVDLDQIEVVVQPQSVIHSMVQYEDGSIIAQLGTPDMRLPIQYALYYPKRRPLAGKRLDFGALGSITFEKPDLKTFRGLALAYEAMRVGGNVPTIFNAANEAAVALFLDQKISYLQITEIIEDCMKNCAFIENPKLEEILDTETQVRERVESRW